MKKYFALVIVAVLSLTLSVFCACKTPAASYKVVYYATNGGNISGKAEQTVAEGKDGEKVNAVPNTGYKFVGWSDGLTSLDRFEENVTNNITVTAKFEKLTFTVKYKAEENGYIIGEATQTVAYGGATSLVTAVPDDGYVFLKWSDGLETANRSEEDVNSNKELTAYFEPLTKTYTYNYKFADNNCEAESVSVTYGKFGDVEFVVPERNHGKFGGWYADKFLTKQVADEGGRAVDVEGLFNSDSSQLYAKWVSENSRQYKILIVYVTELNAELTTRWEDSKIQVNYSMTDCEKQLCRMLTERISFELNDLAVADFCVDEYFTTIPLTEENMTEKHIYVGDGLDNGIHAYDIPEVSDLLEQYDSVLVSFSMNDYLIKLRNCTGLATGKYGYIHFDGCLTQHYFNKEPMENLFNPLHIYWDQFVEPYLHELAHTIELRMNDFHSKLNFHKVLEEFSEIEYMDRLIHVKAYFLNKAVVNGGIPYEFWEGKVSKVFYETQTGGYVAHIRHHNHIEGQPVNCCVQYVLNGEDAIGVIAKTFRDTYEFVGWSDGVTTPERTDINITEDLHVYAIFRPIED